MIDLVSLLFDAIILIDCLHLLVYFFSNNYNIGELTSATSKERITTDIIFTH